MATYLALLILSILSTGCFRFGSIRKEPVQVVLHPIETIDIFNLPKGTFITYTSGDTMIVSKSSKGFSDSFVKKVMKARIGK